MNRFMNTALLSILSIIICFGLIFNILNILVFSEKTMLKTFTFRLLMYLSIVDLLVLIICTTDTLLTFGFFIELRIQSTFMCRIHTFLTYLLTHFSSIFLMTVSIDRAIVVYNLTLKKIQLFKNVKFNVETGLVAFIVIFLSLLDSHFLVLMNNTKYDFRTDSRNSSKSDNSTHFE
jgi:hypothetical protein